MTLIVVEGIDGVGKSTIVKNLSVNLAKHHSVGMMAFPQNRSILKVEYDKTNLDAIMGYHKMFLKDFEEYQANLKEKLNVYEIVILDRYTGSYITYMTYDVFYYKAVVTRVNQFDLMEELDKISEQKVKEIDHLIKPDFTLLIKNYSENLDRLDLVKQDMYSTCLTMLEQEYGMIEGLKRDTMTQVYETLRERKYIKAEEVKQQ